MINNYYENIFQLNVLLRKVSNKIFKTFTNNNTSFTNNNI